jgi:dynein heavy chain 2
MYEYVSRGLFPEDRITFERFVRKRCPKEGQTLRADHTINVREFVRLIYGSDKKVALIMTAPGSDPTGEVQQMAGELRVNQFTILSMGSDVLSQAEQAIAGTGSADNIELLCLTNLHLVIGWLPALQRMLMTANSSVSPNRKQTFVILCTESCAEFPVSLLEMSVKYAYESAPGLRHQLKRLTADVSVPELKILSYLHAVCCERRHYVPQGWTKAYEFGFTDFRSASNVVQTVLTEKDRRLRPEFIRGILGAVIYGGKLDTSVDNDILQV